LVNVDAVDAVSAQSLGLLPLVRAADAVAWAAVVQGGYRPRAFWMTQLDVTVLAALAAINTCWHPEADVKQTIAKAASTASIAASLALLFCHVRPYPVTEAWKLPVRVYALFLAALCGVVNGVTAVDALSAAAVVRAAPSSSSIAAVSVLLVAAAGFIVVLVAAFGYGMIRGAQAEGRSRLALAIQRQRRRLMGTFAAAFGYRRNADAVLALDVPARRLTFISMQAAVTAGSSQADMLRRYRRATASGSGSRRMINVPLASKVEDFWQPESEPVVTYASQQVRRQAHRSHLVAAAASSATATSVVTSNLQSSGASGIVTGSSARHSQAN